MAGRFARAFSPCPKRLVNHPRFRGFVVCVVVVVRTVFLLEPFNAAKGKDVGVCGESEILWKQFQPPTNGDGDVLAGRVCALSVVCETKRTRLATTQRAIYIFAVRYQPDLALLTLLPLVWIRRRSSLNISLPFLCYCGCVFECQLW